MSPPRGIIAQMINDFLHFKFGKGDAGAITPQSPIIGLMTTSNFAHEDGNVWNICEYASNKTGGVNFVASINGLIINTCASFSHSTRCCKGETVQLDKYLIRTKFRFKGLGPKLMRLIMSLYRDADALQIEIGAPNRSGTKCYKKCGFTSINGLNLRSSLTAINSNATLRSSQRSLDLPGLNTTAIKSISSFDQTYLNSTVRAWRKQTVGGVVDVAPTESPWWFQPECVQAIPALSESVLSTREALQSFYHSNPERIPLAADVANFYEVPTENARLWFVESTTEHEGAPPRAICSKLDGEALSALFNFPLVIISQQEDADQVFGSALGSALPAVIYNCTLTATNSSYQAAFPMVTSYAALYESALRMLYHHPRKLQFGESTDPLALGVFPTQPGSDSLLFACCLHKMCRTKEFQPSVKELKECIIRRLIDVPTQLQISVVKLEKYTNLLLNKEETKLLGKEGSVTASVKRHLAFELHQTAADAGSTCLSHGPGATIDVLSHSLVSKGKAIRFYADPQKHDKLMLIHQKLIESDEWKGNVATQCHELANAGDLDGVNHVSLYDGSESVTVDTPSSLKTDTQHVKLIALLMSTSSISAITTSSVTDWITMHRYATVNSTIASLMHDFFAVQLYTQCKRQLHTMWVRKPSRCQPSRPPSRKDPWSLVKSTIHAADFQAQRAQVTDAGRFIRSFCTLFPGADKDTSIVDVAVKATGSGRSGPTFIKLVLGCTVTDTLTGRILKPGQLVQLEFSGTYSWGVFVGIQPHPHEPAEDKLVLRFEGKEDIDKSPDYSLYVTHERHTSKFSPDEPIYLSLVELLRSIHHPCYTYESFNYRRTSSRLKGSSPFDAASTSSSSSSSASTSSSSSSPASTSSSKSVADSSSSAASTPLPPTLLPPTLQKPINNGGNRASSATQLEESEPESSTDGTVKVTQGKKRSRTPSSLSDSAKKNARINCRETDDYQEVSRQRGAKCSKAPMTTKPSIYKEYVPS